jgi:hypothetical protein
MTTRLSALRAAFIDFHANPKAHLDFDNLSHYDTNRDGSVSYIVRGKSLEQVTGLKALGSGCYATAYAIDDKRVLKVLSGTDAGYERFVKKVVKKLPRNPFLPRVFYKGTWGGKRVFILERLAETEICYSSVEGYPKDGNYDERRQWKRDNAEMLEKMEQENRRRSRINSAFRDAIHAGLSGKQGNAFMQLDPKLQAVCDLLKATNSHGDIHCGNVMFRGNTPVLTDPVAGGDETEESIVVAHNESEEEQVGATWGW